ncbi:MAG TPA: hypothetical protein VMW42_05415 [Desulfatiglandales bacterium]|nr:hypothetical protein [Desulfatiglandales bacterium]
MPPPNKINLGLRAQSILSHAVWSEKSFFPAYQSLADEFEEILAFLEAQGQFERFYSRLCARERDGALAEARAGYYFHLNGFKILKWEPEAVPRVPGDIEIAWRNTEAIFLEVKNPGWEGELSEEEINTGRNKLPKNIINAEARSFDPVERVLYAIHKALHKFNATRINLIVVDDNLFSSPLDYAIDILTAKITNEIIKPEYARVSGVFLLNVKLHSTEVEYRTFYIQGKGKPLPGVVEGAFLEANKRFKSSQQLRC